MQSNPASTTGLLMRQVPIRPVLISSFSYIKQLGLFLLSPRWNACPSQRNPQHLVCQYPFIHLGGERHCESKVSCPRTQHNVLSQCLNPEHLFRSVPAMRSLCLLFFAPSWIASLHTSKVAHQTRAYPKFRSIKRQGVLLHPVADPDLELRGGWGGFFAYPGGFISLSFLLFLFKIREVVGPRFRP